MTEPLKIQEGIAGSAEGAAMRRRRRVMRRGFTIRDLTVMLSCLAVAMTLILSVIGANRSLSQAQVCADHLRQLYVGMMAYVEQYKAYPPHMPYPQYMGTKTFNGTTISGWDPNIGFIMTHGLGLVPPQTDSTTGHFIWLGTPLESLPDVCKCPALPPALLDPANPEIDSLSIESLIGQYALSYQTSGTIRCGTRVIRYPSLGFITGIGGRNPVIPDLRYGSQSAQQNDNCPTGVPYVYVMQKQNGQDPADPSAQMELACWIQAVQPAEVQQPSRVYYLADTLDYRPVPGGFPRAGDNSGWHSAYGNQLLLGTRHFEYANVLYLDGRVSRRGQTHLPLWNMERDPAGNGQSAHWRCSTFVTDIRLANIRSQVHIMPVLMVRGWESFFDANGLAAK